ELFVGQAFVGQLADFIEQRRFYRLDLLRIGPEIKGEQSRDESLHLAGADKIGQAHLLTNANKKARAEIAACFVDQLERMSIFAENIDAAVTDHDDALSFFLMAFDAPYSGQWRRWLRVSQGKHARFHSAECLFEKLFDLSRIHIAKNGNDAVLRHDVTVAKFE